MVVSVYACREGFPFPFSVLLSLHLVIRSHSNYSNASITRTANLNYFSPPNSPNVLFFNFTSLSSIIAEQRVGAHVIIIIARAEVEAE